MSVSQLHVEYLFSFSFNFILLLITRWLGPNSCLTNYDKISVLNYPGS